MVSISESAVRTWPCSNPAMLRWPEQLLARAAQPGRDPVLVLLAEGTESHHLRAPGDPVQPGNPVDPVVVGVPQAGEHAAGRQHPGDLRHRAVQVEPVRRLAGQHGVDGLVRQRYRLRPARRRGHAGQPAVQFGQHVRVGLDRDDARPAAVQGQAGELGGELAGPAPRSRILSWCPGGRGDGFERPPDRGGGVVWPVRGVGRGRGPEGSRPAGVLVVAAAGRSSPDRQGCP